MRFVLIALMLVIGSYTMMYGQDDTNDDIAEYLDDGGMGTGVHKLRLNLSHVLYGQYKVGYELQFLHFNTIEISGGLQTGNMLINYDHFVDSRWVMDTINMAVKGGYEWGVKLRSFFYRDENLYSAASYRNNRINLETERYYLTYHYLAYTVGYIVPFSSNIGLDASVNASYRMRSFSYKLDKINYYSDPSRFIPGINVQLYYHF